MYQATFAAEINKTADVFRVELSRPALDAYWEAFEVADDDAFRAACRRGRAECDFMPTIKQLARYMPVRPQPQDPLLTRLLQPWERAEQWPDQAVGRRDAKAKKAAQKWEPKSELEKAVYRRWVDWTHAKWCPPFGES